MAFISNEVIYNEQQEIKRMLKMLLDRDIQHSIEEISLYKAAKLLRRSQDTVLDEVRAGRLKAITYRDSKRKKRYRFRIADIRKYQETRMYDHVTMQTDDFEVESAEEIADRVFPGRKK